MTQLNWYQRLHWRGFLLFLALLVVVSVPTWLVVRAETSPQARRDVDRALGGATVAALLAAAGAAALGGVYLRRRYERGAAVLDGDAVSVRAWPFSDDEISLLSARGAGQLGEARALSAQLEHEALRLGALIESMGEAVMMVDDAERLIVVNPQARSLLRLKRSALGRRLRDVSKLPQLGDAVSQVMWSGEPTVAEAEMERKGGTQHLSVSVSPVFVEDTPTGAVVLAYDVTRLRRLERVRRDFVTNVSHELRTPIASIHSAAETLSLAQLDIPPAHAEFLATIDRNARRMASIVEDLLTLSRLEAAGETLAMGPVDLPAIFAEILNLTEPLARQHGVEYRVDVAEGLPPVLGERSAILQILQNLIENAIKYTPEGGSVTVTARERKRRVRIEVSDTGVGIPAEHLPRIFERFYRVDTGRSREVGGTGLGLAIVKHLVLRLRGRITATSKAGKGTTFRLTLRSAQRTEAQ